MSDEKKKLDRYTAEVAKAIVIIEDKLTRNTITHFENNEVYRIARDSQDMICLIRELRRVGPVGIVSDSSDHVLTVPSYISIHYLCFT